MNFLTTIISGFFIFLIGILPFRILYLFSDFARFFLHRVIGYRKKVITENLERCFPEKSKKEIDILVSKSYKNLTDVIVEGLKAFTMTDKQLKERHKIDPRQTPGTVFIIKDKTGNDQGCDDSRININGNLPGYRHKCSE